METHVGEATCQAMADLSNTSSISDDPADIEYTLDVKIAQIFVVLFSSFAGMTVPLFCSKNISAPTMFLLRAFSAGQLTTCTWPYAGFESDF